MSNSIQPFSSTPNKKIVPSAYLAPTRQCEIVLEDQINQLEQQGYTRGLAKAIMENNDIFSLRIWIIDNSGSMSHNDGHRFVETRNSSDVRVVPCTRWKEIQETVEYHARMAALLKAPTIFRLLNNPGRRVGPQVFGVADKGDHLINSDLQVALSTITYASPSGATPLCRHIYEIQQHISVMAPRLQAEGRKIAIIIATDGLPTDENGVGSEAESENFKNALRSLEGLPVWVTIRLCTDDQIVVNFYNYLDSQLELSIEVLDDFIEEAKEVNRHNKWFNYTLPLHRSREMGFHNRLFDFLDERKLTEGELCEFCLLILGKNKFNDVPDPSVDLDGFLAAIKQMLKKEKKQWNPMNKTTTAIIDKVKVKETYGKSSCIIS